MDWLLFIVGMIAGVLIFELVKHFIFKRTGRIVVFLVIIFILFVIFSVIFIKSDIFKDNQVVKTGAAIAGVFTKNTDGVTKEGVTKGSALFNSTFKKE